MQAETKDADPRTSTQHHGTQLLSFGQVSAAHVRRVLLRSPAKTCALDPLPASVLLEVIDVPFMYICVIAALYLYGVMTSQLVFTCTV